jgi:aryl-alcohol dehydrogenase-like predicted oxidoreductase
MLVRGVENDVLPTCRRYGMGVIPWSPLAAAGCRPLAQGPGRPDSHARRASPPLRPLDPGNQRKLDAPMRSRSSPRRRAVAHRAGARVRHQPPGGDAAIIGPRTMEHLESQLGRPT